MQTGPQVLRIYLFTRGVGGAPRLVCLCPLELSGKNLTGPDTRTLPTFLLVVRVLKNIWIGDLFALHGCVGADFIVLTGCIFSAFHYNFIVCQSWAYITCIVFCKNYTPFHCVLIEFLH